MHSSSQKIFPTVPLCSPALLTQPQRRNTDVRGRSYHVLKLFTPRPGQIRPDSEIRPDLVEWGVNGRLTPYATSHVESVTFPSSHRKNIRPEGETEGRARPVGPAGPASRREVSLLFEYQSHTSGRITLARPAVALWRSGRGALRRQRGRGFESGRGAAVAAAKVALRRWKCSQCVWTDGSECVAMEECTVSSDRHHQRGEKMEQRHRSGNILFHTTFSV